MSDLISREAALELGYWHGKRPDIGNPYGDGVDAVDTADIETLPAVDAVEVVRCRECEDYEDGECVCPYIWTSDGAHIWPEADHFCSYGKKRGENND